MAGSIGKGNIVLLLDNYSSTSRLLHESLQQVAEGLLTIVFAEDNFLPENVISIYDLMTGNYRKDGTGKSGKPRFFNEIPVPDTWSFGAGVQVGDEKSGSITYQQVEKGKIHYVDTAKRWLVEGVEWYDRVGVTRFYDHYNRYGEVCARTVYNPEGEAVSKSWFSPNGREVVMENYITHDIILNDENTICFFQSREELIFYFLKKLDFSKRRIFFNTLSAPYLLANELEATKKEDVLFWQEIAGNEIPWNMRIILDGKACRCNQVIVQTRRAYERLRELGVQENEIKRLGYIYSYAKENRHLPEALICTNSDRIEHCEELIRMLPQMHFHIAALTWMSPALFALEKYDNVSLYPGIEHSVLDGLFMKCDYYFDINYYEEIVSAVYKAFMHNQLIFAFRETIHNREYVAGTHMYSIDEFGKMVSDVRGIMTDRSEMGKHLQIQQRWALAENKETYKEMLGIGFS